MHPEHGSAAVHAFATESGLHRHYARQKAGGSDWAAKSFGDGSEKQQDRKPISRAVGKVDDGDLNFQKIAREGLSGNEDAGLMLDLVCSLEKTVFLPCS
jgi:hypothetical protein